jgi:large subunit ribosomal protein L17
MFRNMVTSLLKYERIQTTDAKAKELRRWADHIITLAKRGDLHARRQVLSIVREKDVVHKLFAEAGERFGATEGGYTRIVKVGRRSGDAAPVSIIELVGPAEGKPRRRRKKKKRETAETGAPAPQAAAVSEEPAAQAEAAGEEGDQEAVAADVTDETAPAGDAAGQEAPSAQAFEPEAAAKSPDEPPPEAAVDEPQAGAEPAGEEEPSDKKG